MILDDVHRGIKKNKPRKRVGRGPGSGHGKTSSRGHKGFYSRSGSSARTGFEGGQTPLFRRVAKRGFSNNFFRLKVAAVNISALEAAFEAGASVGPEQLVERGLTNGKFDVIKILGDVELSKKLTVRAHRFSESARQKNAAAGGTAEVVEKAKVARADAVEK
jgi:large subunit ribosomal protein L15